MHRHRSFPAAVDSRPGNPAVLPRGRRLGLASPSPAADRTARADRRAPRSARSPEPADCPAPPGRPRACRRYLSRPRARSSDHPANQRHETAAPRRPPPGQRTTRARTGSPSARRSLRILKHRPLGGAALDQPWKNFSTAMHPPVELNGGARIVPGVELAQQRRVAECGAADVEYQRRQRIELVLAEMHGDQPVNVTLCAVKIFAQELDGLLLGYRHTQLYALGMAVSNGGDTNAIIVGPHPQPL